MIMIKLGGVLRVITLRTRSQQQHPLLVNG